MSKLYEAFLNEKATPAGKPVPGASGGEDSGAMKYVKQVHGKWALVSRKDGRPLKYFKNKPSRDEADKALRAVEFFKHESVDLPTRFGNAVNKLIEAKDDRKDGKEGRPLKMSGRFDFLNADKERARKRRDEKASRKRHDPDED